MATKTVSPQPTVTKDRRSASQGEKLERLRDLYAGAPDIGRAALDKVMPELEAALGSLRQVATAGRTGLRQGQVSELTIIAPLASGGGKRLRALLDVLGGNFQGADKVGTVHDMRFVLLDNDTKLLFATAYDGDWDPYIDDFATKIPDALDLIFCNTEGFPGLRTPGIKDWIAKHQIPAYAWYVASPDLTVAETRKLERVGKALDQFLDAIAEPA
jgi:hypothetical protein